MLSRNNKSFLPCSKFLIFGNRTLYVSTLLKICIIGQIQTTIRLLMLLQITIHVITIARKGWVGAYYCTTFLSQRFIDLSIFRSNFQWMRINESTTTNQKKLIWRYSVTEPEMPFFHKKIYSKNRSVWVWELYAPTHRLLPWQISSRFYPRKFSTWRCTWSKAWKIERHKFGNDALYTGNDNSVFV